MKLCLGLKQRTALGMHMALPTGRNDSSFGQVELFSLIKTNKPTFLLTVLLECSHKQASYVIICSAMKMQSATSLYLGILNIAVMFIVVTIGFSS